MDNSQKILKMLSGFIEAGILTSQDLKKELSSSIKFKKESFAGKLDLVTKKEFEILKKGDYSVTNQYSQTLNNEKKLIKTLSENLVEELIEKLVEKLGDT